MSRRACDAPPVDPACEGGFPWTGVPTLAPEIVFAQIRPRRLVQGLVGGGSPAPANQVQPTHDLRYTMVDFDHRIDDTMPWYETAKGCGTTARFAGQEGWTFQVRSTTNNDIKDFPQMVTARLLVSGNRALYLEFSGTAWPPGDMERATQQFVDRWSAGRPA